MNVRPSALILENGKILTLKYQYGNHEVFALPGGNPDPGESLAEALIRELGEELGVQLKVGQMLVCGEVIWKEIRKETLHVIFEASISSGFPALNPEHTSALDMVWISLEDADKLILYPNVGREIANCNGIFQTTSHLGVIQQPYLS